MEVLDDAVAADEEDIVVRVLLSAVVENGVEVHHAVGVCHEVGVSHAVEAYQEVGVHLVAYLLGGSPLEAENNEGSSVEVKLLLAEVVGSLEEGLYLGLVPWAEGVVLGAE